MAAPRSQESKLSFLMITPGKPDSESRHRKKRTEPFQAKEELPPPPAPHLSLSLSVCMQNKLPPSHFSSNKKHPCLYHLPLLKWMETPPPPRPLFSALCLNHCCHNKEGFLRHPHPCDRFKSRVMLRHSSPRHVGKDCIPNQSSAAWCQHI